MVYSEYIKEKIINLYFRKEKIGKHLVEMEDFNFLDTIIDIKNNSINQNIYSISQVLQEVIGALKNNTKLQNRIGTAFLLDLQQAREDVEIFLLQTPLKLPQIIDNQRQQLTDEYRKVAEKYYLKEFYYSLNPLLNPQENFNKASLLLDKTIDELHKLQQALDIKEPYKIGNGILSIQVNSQYQSSDNGDYNFLNNTIQLKDENSTFPLIHEYIHFIDKTTSSLLLTGKTTQQLYEAENYIDLTFVDPNSKEYAEAQKNRRHTETELKELFDMSIFTQIDFRDNKFPWINLKQFISAAVFNNEINQAKYIQKTFNYKNNEENNIQNFSNIILNWIEEKNYINKDYLESDIKNLFKDSKYKINHENYSSEENEIIAKSKLFKESQLTDNYFMKCSKLFDKINSERESKGFTAFSNDIDLVNNLDTKYYQTQKEMLARTIEQILKTNNHEQLSDRLTTPKLSDEEREKFFEIIKSWQSISFEILKNQNKEEASNKIQQLLGKFRDIAIEGLYQKTKHRNN